MQHYEEKRHRLQRELKAVEKIYAGTLDWLEQGELYSWVEAGNSPFTNPEQIIHEDGTPFDFIEWHRSARWVTVTETPAVEVSDKERFDFYTERKTEQGSWKKPESSSGMPRVSWDVRSWPSWVS